MKARHLFNSLQFRFAIMAFVVSTLILSAAVYSFFNLNTTRGEFTSNLERRQHLLHATISIDAYLDETYKSLDLFLLDPSKQSQLDNVYYNLDSAIEYCNILLIDKSFLSESEQSTFLNIRKDIGQLKKDIENLVEVRTTPTRQYPSMSIANTEMAPNRDRANNAFAIIFNELDSESSIKTSPDVYLTMVQLRRLWTQMLSNFRLYLANRTGSFNQAALTTQERGIDTFYKEIEARLKDAEKLDEKGKLGFESSGALPELRLALSGWYRGFKKTQEFNRSNQWRMDSIIVQQVISPAFDKINHSLEHTEKRFDQSLEENINNITQLAQQSAWILLAMAVFAIGFVIVLVMLTQKFLFRPVITVSRAMKSQALGKQGHELPIARTAETRGLIDAFNEMFRLVNLRQSELEYRAMHDSLTSLPNRALLFDHIEHDIQLAQRANQQISLMVIDLDRFKEVNDTLGHHVGDKFLIEVGARFSSTLRETDTVARLGGDEFSILIPNMGRKGARKIAEKIIASMLEPVRIDEFELPCSASIGISTYPEDGNDAQTLLQHADIAMYVAKRNQSGFEFYDAKKDEYSIKRLELVNDLRLAIENNQLNLAYQPIINLADGTLCCVEALLRWKHPQHGPVSPELIIDLAEQTGLITPLTNMVLEMALHQQKIWAETGQPLAVSVNLSTHNLRDNQLVDRIREYLDIYKSDENRLILEITESAMMSNPHQVIDILEKLEAMNVTIAIDDFGTGFSSLAYLKKLPVHVLKIDRSFIIDLEDDLNDQAIVQATLSLGHELGLQVVAEGVETPGCQNLLSRYGCDAVQGFQISPPISPDQVTDWLLQNTSRPGLASLN